MNDATMTSPVDGVLTSRVAEPGEQLQAGSPVCVITQLSEAWLTVYVTDVDLARIRIGQEAEVRTDGGQTRKGKLTYIASKAEFTPKNVQTRDERVKLVYEVKVARTKKWKLESKPKAGSCEEVADVTTPYLRFESLDGELFADYADAEDGHAQDGNGATLKKTGECEYDIAFHHADVEVKAGHIVFAGETFSGKTTDAKIDMMEETDEGENQATCVTGEGSITGKRVGD